MKIKMADVYDARGIEDSVSSTYKPSGLEQISSQDIHGNLPGGMRVTSRIRNFAQSMIGKSKSAIMKAGKNAGFTLVELLAVIAIITILISMFIGGTIMAKEKAKNAVCQNNLKQLMLITHMYANNNDGEFPYSGQNNTQAFGQMIGKNPNAEQIKSYLCPSDSSKLDDFSGGYTTLYADNTPSASYTNLNSLLSEASRATNRNCKKPDKTGFIWDSFGGHDGAGAYPEIIRKNQNHGKSGGNVVYVDGHAGFKKSGRNTVGESNPSYDKTKWHNSNQPTAVNPPD